MRGYRPSQWSPDDEPDFSTRAIREEIILIYVARVSAGLPVFADDGPEDLTHDEPICRRHRAVLQ